MSVVRAGKARAGKARAAQLCGRVSLSLCGADGWGEGAALDLPEAHCCWQDRLGLGCAGRPCAPLLLGQRLSARPRGSLLSRPQFYWCCGPSTEGGQCCGGAVPISPILCRHGGGWRCLLPCCCLLGLDVTFGWCCQATRTVELFSLQLVLLGHKLHLLKHLIS